MLFSASTGRLVVRRSLFGGVGDLDERLYQASEEANLPSSEAIALMYGRIIE